MGLEELKLSEALLNDLRTYMIISVNNNYKDRLLEAYYLLKKNKVMTKEEFETCNIGLGAFTYSEITIFDRIKDESYQALLAASKIEIDSIRSMPKDYGDQLASYGTVGKTPYRDRYIKDGWITEGLSDEEKIKHCK